MFSKRHYKALANLAGSLALGSPEHDRLVMGLADLCEKDNPLFSRSRFHAAADLARSETIATAEDGETERRLARGEDGGRREALNAVLSITMDSLQEGE